MPDATTPDAPLRTELARDPARPFLTYALLQPLAVGGSAALVSNEDPSGREARGEAERVADVVTS